MATSTLGSGTLVLAGTTSGTTTVTATAVAGTTTLTLPAATDTLVGKATTDTLTNKTLTGAVMNGTLGATTPSTVAATTLTTSSTVTHNGGTANGVGYLDGSKVLTTGSALVFNGTSLGLGITPSAWGSGVLAYQATGSSFFVGDTRNYFATNVYLNSAYATTYIGSRYALQYYQDATAGTHAWYQAASGTAGNAITFTQAMTLDASGNLGIGATTISSMVHLRRDTSSGTSTAYPNIRLDNPNAAGYTGLYFFADGTQKAGLEVSNAAGALQFFTSTTEKARIDSSGNLLVGTTTANGRLSIDSAGTTSATYIIFGRNSAASNKFTVRSDGAGFLDSAAWTYGSDATIKENIEYLEPSNCLSLLLNAKPAKFDYIEGQKANYGYIAQDVQKWLPEAVSETPNGKLGLQDGFINALGTGAIQALNQLIQEQQALIQTLTARITALESA